MFAPRPGYRACVAVTLWVAAAAGCRGHGRIDSCRDPLAGVWRGDDGNRYHAIEEGGRVDVYPMFNAARVDGDIRWAPYMFGFARTGDTLTGKRSQRAERGDRVCTIRTDAAIASCGDDTLLLRYRPVHQIDWARCATEPQGHQTLTLRR